MAGKKKAFCNINPDKKWGGKRKNSGFKAKWNHSPTKLIRVPEALEEDIPTFAHDLDENDQTEQKGMLYPNTHEKTAEDLRQQTLTLEAITHTVETWRQELSKHKRTTPRWQKVHQLIEELEAHLHTIWL